MLGNGGAQALWSRSITGSIENASIDGSVVVFGLDRGGFGAASTQAYDVRTGRQLWELTGALPLSGSPVFLAVGKAVERVDARSGRVLWRSKPLCGQTATVPENTDFTPPAVALPTYAAAIRRSVYIGCNGGKIFALHLSSGRVLASAYPAYLDKYDQIVALGNNALGIGGTASGAYMYRQSAIVKEGTLATVAPLGFDARIIGTYDQDAVIENTCCLGRHSDSWPADLEFVSLESGEVVSSASLHPYQTPLPRDNDLAGPGVALTAGDTLYVATHSRLLAYDLSNLDARPRVVYSDVVGVPTVIDDRYFLVERGKPGAVRSNAILDAYDGLRVIWSDVVSASPATSSNESTRQELLIFQGRVRPVTVDASCMRSASNEAYAFTVCRSGNIASYTHLGKSAKPIAFGPNTLLPQSIAVYSSFQPPHS